MSIRNLVRLVPVFAIAAGLVLLPAAAANAGETGGSIDPNGLLVDGGMSIDPDGMHSDEGMSIDPNG